MTTASVRLGAPWLVDPGEEVRVGEASVRRTMEGDVEACDRYGCRSVKVPPRSNVYLLPIPALYRMLGNVSYIYVEFPKPILVEDGGEYWTMAPIELEVFEEDISLARLSPTMVKYTLIGDVLEGTIARYHKAGVAFGEEALQPPTGTAILKFKVSGDRALLPGIGFNADGSELYTGEGDRLYYPVVEVVVEGKLLTARRTSRPPHPRLKHVKLEASEQFKYKRVPLPVPVIMNTAPFTMKVEVIKRYVPQG